MKLINIFLFTIIFSSSCNQSNGHKKYERAKHSIIAEKITEKVAQKIEIETGLHLIGTGGGMMDCVKMMAMSFRGFGEIDVIKGRALIVHCVREYLSAINENLDIRPYLSHYPFTSKGIQIRIFITQTTPTAEALCFIGEIDGAVEYDVRKAPQESPEIVHQEPYEEAVRILESERRLSHL
jgi:hypothetical protein